jgi:hypothetical protein
VADIKQAAKWLDEGKSVGRKWGLPALAMKSSPQGFVEYDDGSMVEFEVSDLLADDWEIAD